MDLTLVSFPCSLIFSLFLSIIVICKGVSGATFTFANKCDYTVWPGILSSAGSPPLESTGFELPRGTSRSFQAPPAWSGRFWGRTLCNFDGSGGQGGSCATGDCGSGQVECNGAGAAPPATLAEFTLGSGSGSGSGSGGPAGAGDGTLDFYDVSLVDGYNLPMIVEAAGGSGSCVTTGCVTDLNQQCPAELKVGDGEACKSACEAFGTPEYCCSGEYGSPSTCKPSVYSEMFKSACPRSYSYAYDDATSTFTCMGADYLITFCPPYSNRQKSSRDSTTPPPPPPRTTTTGGSGSEGAMFADGSWLEGLATGDSTRMTAATTIFILLSTNFLFFYSYYYYLIVVIVA